MLAIRDPWKRIRTGFHGILRCVQYTTTIEGQTTGKLPIHWMAIRTGRSPAWRAALAPSAAAALREELRAVLTAPESPRPGVEASTAAWPRHCLSYGSLAIVLFVSHDKIVKIRPKVRAERAVGRRLGDAPTCMLTE